MKTTSVFFVACLVGLALGAEAGDQAGVRAESPKKPTVFIRFDALDFGGAGFQNTRYYSGGQGGVFLKAVAQAYHLRVGLAALELWGDIGDGTAGPVPIPMPWTVYGGIDIWHNPKRTTFFYGAVPDIYIEAGTSLGRDLGRPSISKVAVVGDIDYYGLGLRLEGGEYFSPKYRNTAYFSVMVRLLTFGVGI
jgi:hypothetical protein